MRLRFFVFIVVTTLWALLPFQHLVAQEQPQSPVYDPAEVTPPVQIPVAALGEQIFLENCAPCHGQTGDGDGPVVANLPKPPPPLTDPATIWERSPAEYFHITKFGRIGSLMPPWQNQLNDEQIWRAAYYAWSLHTDQETVQVGGALWEALQETLDADVQTQLAELTAPDTMLFRTQSELADDVRSLADEAAAWDDEELQSVLDYLRTQNYAPPWESAFQRGTGSIQGQVLLNKMVDDVLEEQPIGGVDVTVSAFAGRSPIATLDTTTDDTGQFLFDELATDSGIFYIVETRYEEILYSSEVIELSAAPAASVDLPVFETTDDPAGLAMSRVNWVLDFEPGALVVGQILSIGMTEPATFVGRTVAGVDVPVTVQLQLPEGAYDLQFQDGIVGGRYWQAGQSVYDSAPVTPGAATRQIFMSYRLLLDGKGVQFAQEFLYPIERLNLLVADLPELSVEIPQLEFMGNESIQNVPYRLWNGQALEPGSIGIGVDGAIGADEVDPRPDLQGAEPAPGAGLSSADPNPLEPTRSEPPLEPTVALAVGGLLFLILAVLFGFSFIRLKGVDQPAAMRAHRDELIGQIALLDDERSTDLLDEATWTQQRATLKTHLLDLANQMADAESKNAPKPLEDLHR